MPTKEIEYSEWLRIATGITGDAQQSDFMNGTLQSAGIESALEFTVQTFVGVPASVTTEAELRDYLRSVFGQVEALGLDLAFDIQIGPAGDGSEA